MKLPARICYTIISVTTLFFVFPAKVFALVDSSCTNGGNVGVKTALGCIPIEMDKFMAWFLPYLFGIGGGIAFLLMIYGFILLTTSQGDPKAVQGAKETITSAIVGLLVCIFAIFILRLIAIDILKIPGIS